MEKMIRRYAKFLIDGCLGLKKNDKLFITAYDTIADFVNLVIEEAHQLGINDIKTLIQYPEKQKELYLTGNYDKIINSPYFDRTIFNQMAREGYAFLSLQTTLPGYFDEIDAHLMSKVMTYQAQSIAFYKEYQLKGKIKWNIACVPNDLWAKDLFGVSDKNKLWDYILSICLIKDDPYKAWSKKIAKLKRRAHYLNSLNIDKLIYTNNLGTNLEIGLPNNYIFESASGKNIVNMPTEEIFSTPDRLRVNGIVYASKPLIYNNHEINDFWIKFSDGKIIEYDAKKGKDILKGIIETDAGSHYLGEVALVDYDSPISNTNLVFKHTLYDENASCHLAIGEGFLECIKDGLQMNKEKLLKSGINLSHEHVDFFIGTRDLVIKAILKNKKEIVIMDKGNFVWEDNL